MAINYKFNNNVGATGQLGAPDMQAKFGTQFIPTGRFSVQGNREFDTYANALNYVYKHDTAFPGIILTVSDDENPENNGAYLVQHDETLITSPTGETMTLDGEVVDNPNALKLTKIMTQNDGANLEWNDVPNV